ncbi:MAG: hypothetical protein H6608_07305 [Flavobacteriales bacterium]|nr:hypothetical protein [Bacteroidota bacterium]MCB9240920.1 hypothetical protein [Flavobacteriales bacterium]
MSSKGIGGWFKKILGEAKTAEGDVKEFLKNATTAWTVHWSEVEPLVQTGDILLMHGKFPSSKLIEVIERSIWSHSAMVVRSKDIGLSGPGIPELVLWESNDLTNLPDLILNKTKTGPMIVDLNKRLQTNLKDGSDVLFSLVQVHFERTPEMMQGLKDLIPKVHNAVFPSMEEMGYEMATGRYYHKSTSLDKIYCAELVGASLDAMGLLTKNYPWNGYEPRDFSAHGSLPLLGRATFQPEIHFDLK